ncbi:MAG TPA: methyltransferase [Anaeromyxobacteraceae bacterium]|nr:methyltransferase [Anaeromyxobacteraceae bacterium]
MDRNATSRWERGASNLAVALFYASFVYRHLIAYRQAPRASLVIIVVMEALLAAIVVLRAPAERTSFSLRAWVTTLGGTLGPLLLRPVPGARDVLAGDALQVAGATLALLGVLSLNRSFGLLPAKRGIRSQGLYRWVRHPLYGAYLILYLGYAASNPSLANAAILAIATACQVLRLLNEEAFLSQYEDYQRYRSATRWRLLPYVF